MPGIAKRRRPEVVGDKRRTPSAGKNGLDAIWAALNIARDNKALVLASGGFVVHVNQLASDLCGRAAQDLVGRCVVSELFAAVPAGLSTQTAQRWETEVK